MWHWIEAEDFISAEGNAEIVDDWGAGAHRYVAISDNTSVSLPVPTIRAGKNIHISIRCRTTGNSDIRVLVSLGQNAAGVEIIHGDHTWHWHTVTLQPSCSEQLHLRVKGGVCDLDGVFVHDQEMDLPSDVHSLNAIAGAMEVEASLQEEHRLFDISFSQTIQSAHNTMPLEMAKELTADVWPVLKSLSQKPCPYIVKAYDTQGGTDYNADYSWHTLDKERRWVLPWSNMLGVVNPNSDIAYTLGFSLDGSEEIDFRPAFRPVLHLVDWVVYQVDLEEDIICQVSLRCFRSHTLIADVHIMNQGDKRHSLHIAEALCKHPLDNPPTQRYVLPAQKFGSGVETTAGGVAWTGESRDGRASIACFYEWVRSRSRGRRLMAAMLSSDNPKTTYFAPGDDPQQTPVVSRAHSLEVNPREAKHLTFTLNMRRYTLHDTWNPSITPELYLQEDENDAIRESIEACEMALVDKYADSLRASLEPYRTYPQISLPESTWAGDFYACIELIRASTFSPLGAMKLPFYNFCRVHAHEPFNWWSYGMHAHETLIALFQNFVDPGLSQDFIRGHYHHQTDEGRFPYGVSHALSSRTKSTPEATLPVLIWEAWQAYLWSGDRQFLEESYKAGRRNIQWYLKTRDRCGEGLCHYCNYSWESSRDDNGLPTWQVTGGAMYQEALDLNCYLHMHELTLAAMASELGLEDESKELSAQALDRAKKMNAYMWHDEDRCYYGIGEVVPAWADVKDISTFYPLWAGIAPAGRFEPIAQLIDDPETFNTPFGPPTLARNEPCFGPEKHWFGSNWVEMTLFVILGLKHYGYYSKASKLAYQNTKMVFDELDKYGHFREYFNSIEGHGVDLIDYNWTAMPAFFIVDILLGIRPTSEGLEILPALPAQWDHAEIRDLKVRGKSVSVWISRDLAHRETCVNINGHSEDSVEGRGVIIPWDELEDGTVVEIVQPWEIPDTPQVPPEVPRDWSDIPPHQYPDDPDLVRMVREAMVSKDSLK